MNTIELPQTIYKWMMDIDYGHKTSMGWIFTIWGPEDLDKVEDYVETHLNWNDTAIQYDDMPNPDGTYDSWEEPIWCHWYPDTKDVTPITDPHAILRHYHDEGIVGFGAADLTSTDIDNIQEYFGLPPIFGPKYFFHITKDVENPEREGTTLEIPF